MATVEKKNYDKPIKVLSAEVVAREVVRLKLMEELPVVIQAIKNAMEDGKTSCYFDGNMSQATQCVLEKAGYDLYGQDSYQVEISWSDAYDGIADDEDAVLEILEEVGIRIITVDEYRNLIDRD